VERVLHQADEQLEHTQCIKDQGYNFQTIVQRVAVLLDLPIEEIQSASKRSVIVKARSMVCYWILFLTRGQNRLIFSIYGTLFYI
jgi:chromosomal replication initiation ATPase DnaA